MGAQTGPFGQLLEMERKKKNEASKKDWEERANMVGGKSQEVWLHENQGFQWGSCDLYQMLNKDKMTMG